MTSGKDARRGESADPLKGPASPAIREIEDLLKQHGAMKPQVAALQIWSAARQFLEPKRNEPLAAGKWLVEELEKQGHKKQSKQIAEIWPDLSRPLLDDPTPDVFWAAIDALEKAKAKISAFPRNSSYARDFGREAQRTLQALIHELHVSGDIASRMPKPKGGAPKTGGFEFFVEALAIWYVATNRSPPRKKLHSALLDLLYALDSDDDPKGTSFETFKDALSATEAWYERESSKADAPPEPLNAKFEVKRSTKQRKRGSSKG